MSAETRHPIAITPLPVTVELSAEEVAAYLLATGWTVARSTPPTQSFYLNRRDSFAFFHDGEVSTETIEQIAHAEKRHPLDVARDIIARRPGAAPPALRRAAPLDHAGRRSIWYGRDADGALLLRSGRGGADEQARLAPGAVIDAALVESIEGVLSANAWVTEEDEARRAAPVGLDVEAIALCSDDDLAHAIAEAEADAPRSRSITGAALLRLDAEVRRLRAIRACVDAGWGTALFFRPTARWGWSCFAITPAGREACRSEVERLEAEERARTARNFAIDDQ